MPSHQTFDLTIMLPEATYPAREVISLDIPASDGRMTILARHQPMLIAITEGKIFIQRKNAPERQRECWQVGEGAVLIQPSGVTITTHSATLNH